MSPSAQSPTLDSLRNIPRSARELYRTQFDSELRMLRDSKLFWLGAVLKLSFAIFFGSHFATRWFAPFTYEFVHGHFANPWTVFLDRGEPLAFPYGPGMLVVTSLAWIPALFTSFDPSSHFGLFLLRIPAFAADIAICVVLMRWLRTGARDAVIAYWLSPVVIYGTYVHGQLDIIPTALLCVALLFVFSGRTISGAVLFGFALATKLHLLIALPFVVVFLYRSKKNSMAWLQFAAIACSVALAMYAIPLSSEAFRTMVFGNAESLKVWAVGIPYGVHGLVLYVAPAAILIAFLRFASYRKLNRELTLMFIGTLYVGLVALVPPQPGWFIWSIPFVAYLGARFTRTGRFILVLLASTYLLYFFVADPETFLEAADPTLGAGFGAHAANALLRMAPGLGQAHAASVTWSGLFSVTVLAGFEMYRKGVRSNSIYDLREESFMIGIAGDSGAGKHTIATDLAALIGSQISIINGDDDHKWERGHAMWRRFTHLDPRGNMLGAQSESMSALRQGGDVRKPHYDHSEGRFTSPLTIKPNDFMAIVGLHPFYLPLQREVLHLKIFVDPEENLRRRWKVNRDMQKRGYTREQVLDQIEKRMPDSAKYVRPQLKYADVILRQHETENENDEGENVAMSIELKSSLAPLALLDGLDVVGTLDVSWTPDEDLTLDTIIVRGSVSVVQLQTLANAILPNADELVTEEGWLPGNRGLVQLAILYAISMRARTSSSRVENIS